MRVERVELGAIVDLRWRVLRAGMPRESAVFANDEAPTSAHFAAHDAGGGVIGCVTLHRQPFPSTPSLESVHRDFLANMTLVAVWQLRGMAIDPAHQRSGVGTVLLKTAETYAATAAAGDEPSAALWCNARKPAVPFYERYGWVVVSDEFDVPTAGPHQRMVRLLTPAC